MTDIASALVGVFIGIFIGQFVRFRRVDVPGGIILKPALDTRPFRSRLLNVALVMMFVVATATTVWSTYTQRECNFTFQASLKNNAAIGAQDRALEVRDDALREQRDDALDVLVGELLGPVESESRVHSVLHRYRVTTQANDAERERLNEERHALEAQRLENPYPDPRC